MHTLITHTHMHTHSYIHMYVHSWPCEERGKSTKVILTLCGYCSCRLIGASMS